MKACHLTPQDAWDFPLIQAHAYIAYAEQNNGFCAVEMVSAGYILQEEKRHG